MNHHHRRVIKPSASTCPRILPLRHLNLMRSSKEQGCASLEHCSMWLVVPSSLPQPHVEEGTT